MSTSYDASLTLQDGRVIEVPNMPQDEYETLVHALRDPEATLRFPHGDSTIDIRCSDVALFDVTWVFTD